MRRVLTLGLARAALAGCAGWLAGEQASSLAASLPPTATVAAATVLLPYIAQPSTNPQPNPPSSSAPFSPFHHPTGYAVRWPRLPQGHIRAVLLLLPPLLPLGVLACSAAVPASVRFGGPCRSARYGPGFLSQNPVSKPEEG